MCFHLNSLEELHTFTVRLLSVVTTNAGVSADGGRLGRCIMQIHSAQ